MRSQEELTVLGQGQETQIHLHQGQSMLIQILSMFQAPLLQEQLEGLTAVPVEVCHFLVGEHPVVVEVEVEEGSWL